MLMDISLLRLSSVAAVLITLTISASAENHCTQLSSGSGISVTFTSESSVEISGTSSLAVDGTLLEHAAATIVNTTVSFKIKAEDEGGWVLNVRNGFRTVEVCEFPKSGTLGITEPIAGVQNQATTKASSVTAGEAASTINRVSGNGSAADNTGTGDISAKHLV
jgi:hypothetical protein